MWWFVPPDADPGPVCELRALCVLPVVPLCLSQTCRGPDVTFGMDESHSAVHERVNSRFL